MVIFAALFAPPTFGAEAEATDAEAHYAALLAMVMKKPLVSRILDSGVARTDAESTADAAILEYAKCAVSALREIDNPAAAAFLSALDERLSPQDLDTRLREVGDEFFAEFILELNNLTEPCRIDVDSRLGIPPEM